MPLNCVGQERLILDPGDLFCSTVVKVSSVNGLLFAELQSVARICSATTYGQFNCYNYWLLNLECSIRGTTHLMANVNLIGLRDL